jgi:hypothetical protein
LFRKILQWLKYIYQLFNVKAKLLDLAIRCIYFVWLLLNLYALGLIVIVIVIGVGYLSFRHSFGNVELFNRFIYPLSLVIYPTLIFLFDRFQCVGGMLQFFICSKSRKYLSFFKFITSSILIILEAMTKLPLSIGPDLLIHNILWYCLRSPLLTLRCTLHCIIPIFSVFINNMG